MDSFFGINIEAFIRAAGLLGVFAIVFAESGLLIGVFLPGDSLLFTAGFLASQGYANIWILAIGCFIAAIAGDNVGYFFGRRVGRRFFAYERSRIFNPKNLDRAQQFYERYGASTVLFGRFLAVIRTFTPILAGIGHMPYRRFLIYDLIGAFAWGVGLTLLGYFLGSTIPNVDHFLLPIIGTIIIISLIPSFVTFLRTRRRT